MFKKIFLALALISCATISSCSSNDAGVETPIHSIPTDYTYYVPEYSDDEDGDLMIPIELLVDSVDYLAIPPLASENQLIDSLVYTYNLITFVNAFDADALTYSRELAEPAHINPRDLDWIKEEELRNLFIQLDKATYNINNSDDGEEYNQATSNIVHYINENYLDALYAKVDTTELDKALAPTTYVKDIESLHGMILTDPAKANKTLKDRVISEKYFIPQAHLAEEYALSCYALPGRRDEITGLLEEIMKADLYSPNLDTIWRMWRARNQMYHSPSNDGVIFNHYYNTFRNRIAKTYLEYYIKTGASDALYNFLGLAIEPNIIRQGTFIGNYATLEDMRLFWGPTQSEDSQESE